MVGCLCLNALLDFNPNHTATRHPIWPSGIVMGMAKDMMMRTAVKHAERLVAAGQ
jgi:hypothetical protein